MQIQKSYMAKEDIKKQKEWYLIDANEQVLGRLATKIATILMGKHKPTYTPHIDTGDYVIVTNAGKIKVTGKKMDQKRYYRYSGYPSGLRSNSLREILEKKPEKVLYLAVRRMLPKNRLGRRMLKKLKIYTQSEHPHTAQCPQILEN
mgnify:CR=1 FL=1